MKKHFSLLVSVLLVVAMLAGCDSASNAETPATEAPVADPVIAATEVSTEAVEEVSSEAPAEEPAEEEEDIVYEGDASSYYIDVAYPEQIARYHTALVEKWDEGKYFENGMSALPYYYYDGNPLDNVGFDFVDLDNDGHLELIIGAILNADEDPAVFEIWTLVDGEPVMLAQGGTRNRYLLEYVEEDRVWYVVNEASGSAFNHATYYLMLTDGKLEVMQGIVYDAEADEKNPWFMTYDLDWDVSNDEPIDEEMANAILESHRRHYIAREYFPYIFY